MAQRVNVQYIDDMDGRSEATQSITFGIDGALYEIDLNEKHADKLRNALAPFIEHGRKVKGTAKKATRSSSNGSTANPAAVREWARENGISIPDRGRIPREVAEQYAAAN